VLPRAVVEAGEAAQALAQVVEAAERPRSAEAAEAARPLAEGEVLAELPPRPGAVAAAAALPRAVAEVGQAAAEVPWAQEVAVA